MAQERGRDLYIESDHGPCTAVDRGGGEWWCETPWGGFFQAGDRGDAILGIVDHVKLNRGFILNPDFWSPG